MPKNIVTVDENSALERCWNPDWREIDARQARSSYGHGALIVGLLKDSIVRVAGSSIGRHQPSRPLDRHRSCRQGAPPEDNRRWIGVNPMASEPVNQA